MCLFQINKRQLYCAAEMTATTAGSVYDASSNASYGFNGSTGQTRGLFLFIRVKSINYASNAKQRFHRQNVLSVQSDEMFFSPDRLEPYSEHAYWMHAFVTHDIATPVTENAALPSFGVERIALPEKSHVLFEMLRSVEGIARGRTVPPSTMLCFNGYCYQATDARQICVNTKGSANVYLETLASTASGDLKLDIVDPHFDSKAKLGEIEFTWQWKAIRDDALHDNTGQSSDDESIHGVKRRPENAPKLDDVYVDLQDNPVRIGLIKFDRKLYFSTSVSANPKNTFPSLPSMLSTTVPATRQYSDSDSDDESIKNRFNPLSFDTDDVDKIENGRTTTETLNQRCPRYIVPETQKEASFIFKRLQSESLAIYYPRSYHGALAASVPYVEDIHCPYYMTDTGMVLPASAYSYTHSVVPTTISTLEHLLDKALIVQNMTAEQFIADYAKLLISASSNAIPLKCCVVLGEFLTLPVVLEPYSSDVAIPPGGTKPVDTENFQVPRACGAQDCEGMAAESNVLFKELTTFPIESDREKTPIYEALCALRKLALAYAPFMCLAAVTSASFSSSSVNNGAVFAHTFFALFPRARVSDFMLQYDVEKNTWKPPRKLAVNWEKWERALPLLICEGTNRVHPLQQPLQSVYKSKDELSDALEDARCDTYAHNILESTIFESDENVKATFYQKETKKSSKLSSFYLRIVSAYVCWEPLIELGVTDVTFGNARTMTYGIPFEDFVTLENFNMFLDSSLEKHEALLIADALNQCEPIAPYRKASFDALSRGRKNRKDEITKALEEIRLQKHGPDLTPRAEQLFWQSYYVRLEDVTDRHLEDIAKILHGHGKQGPASAHAVTMQYRWDELVCPANMPDGDCLIMLTLQFQFVKPLLST